MLARIAQTTAAIAKLETIWRDKTIFLQSKIHLLHFLALSIFL